jgi:hypothetical protein
LYSEVTINKWYLFKDSRKAQQIDISEQIVLKGTLYLFRFRYYNFNFNRYSTPSYKSKIKYSDVSYG